MTVEEVGKWIDAKPQWIGKFILSLRGFSLAEGGKPDGSGYISSSVQFCVQPLRDQVKTILTAFVAGHDNAVPPERARGSMESEMPLHAGCNLYIHGEHPHCSEPFWAAAPHVWRTHDGTVPGGYAWGAVAARVCHCRLCVQADAERNAKPIYPGARNTFKH